MNGRLSRPLVVAFVSGKGGVGKTSLATNFAWLCAKVAPTVLLDLDFPNQGMTGLVAGLTSLDGMDVPTALGAASLRASDLMELAPDLRFMPATAWTQPAHVSINQRIPDDFDRQLHDLLEKLTVRCEQDIVVMDCHGGVDAVSAAAFKCSDVTMMVTEADSVTFAGTLELLAHYRASLESGVPLDTLRNGRRSSEPTVRFVVNRLAGKFRYDDLEQICYAAQLRELSRPDEFGRFSHDSSVLCYIPTDSIVSESFGEYPFQIEIAPNVVFSRKVALMLWSLLRDAREPFDDDIKPLARMNKTGYREKVRRTVISAEERYTRWIIGGFAWWSTAFVFAGALVLAAMLINFVAGQTIEHLIHSLRPFRRIGITFGILACIAMLIYGGKVFFSLAGYYAARHSFQRRLLRLLGRPPSAWQRLSLFRLLLLRIGTLVVACLLSIYLFLAVVAVLMVGVRALISI